MEEEEGEEGGGEEGGTLRTLEKHTLSGGKLPFQAQVATLHHILPTRPEHFTCSNTFICLKESRQQVRWCDPISTRSEHHGRIDVLSQGTSSIHGPVLFRSGGTPVQNTVIGLWLTLGSWTTALDVAVVGTRDFLASFLLWSTVAAAASWWVVFLKSCAPKDVALTRELTGKLGLL